MLILAIALLILINLAVTYYPPIYYSRLAGENGRYLFIVPAIIGLPVYLARILSPFYLDLPSDDLPYFAIALICDNLYGMAQILAILVIWKYLNRPRLSRLINYPFFSVDLTQKRKRRRLKLFGIVLLVLAIGCLIVLAIASGFGVGNWISAPRVGYQEYRRGHGQYWVLSQILLSLSSFIFLHTSRSRLKFATYALVNGYVWWFLGSKAFLLGFGAFAVAMWFYKFGRSYFVFVVFATSVFSLMVANWLINRDLAINNFDTFRELFDYFNMYQVGIMYYKEYYANQIGLFHGYIFLSNFWSYVPRALYESKPWVYGITVIVEHFFPGAPEAGNTPGFAGSVEQFADFGYLGLLLAPFLDLTFLIKTAATIIICRTLRDGSWISGRLFLLSMFFLSPNWTPWAGGLYLLGFMVAFGFVFLCLNLLGRKRGPPKSCETRPYAEVKP